MKSFNNKVAVITGAGSGIGQSLALQLARQGCHLALSDINESALLATQTRIASDKQISAGLRVTTALVDVADRGQMEQFAEQVIANHGRVNLLFNNAGVAVDASLDDASYTDMEWLMGINFWGVVHGSKSFLPHLIANGEGHIVNVSSVFGLFAVPGQSIYNSSKFAVRGFTEALRLECRYSPVDVSAAFPAGIKTNIARNARMAIADGESRDSRVRYAEALFINTADRAAADILAGVKKRKARILVGRGAGWADVLSRLIPVWTGNMIAAIRRRSERQKALASQA